MAQLTARRQGIDVDLKQLAGKVASAETDLRAVDGELKKMKPDIKRVQSDLDKREEEAETAQKTVNASEDKIFAQFCRQVGVRNIRQYEQEAVTTAKQHNEHRLQLSSQESRLTASLEYARSRDLDGPRKEIKSQIKADTKQLGEVKAKLSGVAKREDSMLEELESLKSEMRARKKEESAAQDAVKSARKANADQLAACSQTEKELTDVLGKIRVLQSRRHAVLRRATVEEIEMPYSQGDSFKEPSNTQSQVEVFDAEDELDFDFSDLRAELAAVDSDVEYNRLIANIDAELQAVTLELVRMNPNLKAVDKLREVQEKAKGLEGELKDARGKTLTAAQEFQEVRDERLKMFMDCFKHVSDNIERIYDALTRSGRPAVGGLPAQGKAFLTLQNSSDPWESGITYQTIPPSKRLWNVAQLSGGEKSLASLALIFAVQSFRPSPFFVLDEIDAALDAQNVEKVCRYIFANSKECQFIVISLKDSFFSQADALIGVYKDNQGECSRTLSVDMSNRAFSVAAGTGGN